MFIHCFNMDLESAINVYTIQYHLNSIARQNYIEFRKHFTIALNFNWITRYGCTHDPGRLYTPSCPNNIQVKESLMTFSRLAECYSKQHRSPHHTHIIENIHTNDVT